MNQLVKSIVVLVGISSIFFMGTALADDAPDSKIETNFYIKHSGAQMKPTDEGDWLMVSGQTPHKTYTTKRKESLVEISNMLFGDPHFWTKLWSLNKAITNPYEVPAGTTISVSDATSDLPPSVGVTFNAFPDPTELGDIAGPDILGGSLNAEVPPSTHEKASAIDELPKSLPKWKYRNPDLITLDLDRPIVNIPVPVKNLDFFVSENKADAVGEVVGTEMNLTSAGEFQYIYVHFDSKPAEKNYTVIKDAGVVKGDFIKGSPMMEQVLGNIEILEPVNSDKGTYRALVVKALDNVSVGAKLVVGPMPTYAFSADDPIASQKATIMGGHFSQNRHIFGSDGIVFLDHGKSDGMIEGQVLPVYQYQRSRLDGKFIKENPQVVGKIKVVKVTDRFSTAVVLNSTGIIEVGDGTSPDLIH